MSTPNATLFNLLPSVYRIRDAQIAVSRGLQTSTGELAPGPLQSILMVVEEQLAILADNLDQLYDDQFIETCAPWVVPYIGELIDYQSIYGVGDAVSSPRAEVANTISFRRRKGTVLVMEQLARDATGWGAHAVEAFLKLATSQYMNHIRPRNHYAPNLRKWKPREYMNTGFDKTAHTVDVRRVAVQRGFYNLQNIGIFLWSLGSYTLTKTSLIATSTQPQCARVCALGRDIPLFHLPQTQGQDITDPARPVNVPKPLSRHELCRDIVRITQKNADPVYYGEGLSLCIYRGGIPVPPSDIEVGDLSGDEGSWVNVPALSGKVAVDPELGRICDGGDDITTLTASYCYGFNADMGGGEYSRASTFALDADEVAVAKVPSEYSTIQAALDSLAGDGIVEVSGDAGSGNFIEATLSIAVKANGHIELRAADRCRPTVFCNGITISGGDDSQLDINGLRIAYTPQGSAGTPAAMMTVTPGGTLSQLTLKHLTLVPGWALQPDGWPQPAYTGLPTLQVEQANLTLTANCCVLGAVLVTGDSTAAFTSCVLDSTAQALPAYAGSADPTPLAGGALTLDGCTVIGKVYAALLTLVSNSIALGELSAADTAEVPPLWQSALWSARRQQGCVRFSYLPEDPIVPTPYECVTAARNVPAPVFYSLRYGDPGYAKLRAATDDSIRRGADDGGEMGCFHFLLAPLRESDLRTRMQEFMPVGLEFGVFYQN